MFSVANQHKHSDYQTVFAEWQKCSHSLSFLDTHIQKWTPQEMELYLEDAQLIKVIVWEAPLTAHHEVHNWP